MVSKPTYWPNRLRENGWAQAVCCPLPACSREGSSDLGQHSIRGAPNGSRRRWMNGGFLSLYIRMRLLPAGTAVGGLANTNGAGLEIRYLARR